MFLLVTNTRTYVAGDKRSRTNPGHGYPGHTETHQRVEEFDDTDQLEKRMLKLRDGEPYQAYEAKKITTAFKRTVEFGG